MSGRAQVEVRFAALEESGFPDPDSRVVHRFEITVLDPDGEGWPDAPCGVATANLDHGITIAADPMRTDGLLGATVDVSGEAIAEIGRHFDDAEADPDDRVGAGALSDAASQLIGDLFGPEAVDALAPDSALRDVGDHLRLEVATDRWEVARQLAWCETEASRTAAPTTTTPSIWAADAARLAQRLSPALADWAERRSVQAAAALSLLPAADALGALAPVWPDLSELVTIVTSLAGRTALEDLATLFDHEPPPIEDWDAAFTALTASEEDDLLLRAGTFRGARVPQMRDVPPALMGTRGGPERTDDLAAVLIGPVSALIDEHSVRTEWRDGELVVRARLSGTGHAASQPSGGRELLAGELAVVCALADTGEGVADRGFAQDGRALVAVLPLPPSTGPGSRYEVRIHRRGHDDRRPRRDRERARAVEASRDALRATCRAFSGAVPDPEANRALAAEQWDEAADRWASHDQEVLARRCRDLARACRTLARSADDPEVLLTVDLGLPETLVADRVAPGIRAVLHGQADRVRRNLERAEDWPPEDPDGARAIGPALEAARTFAALARTLDLDLEAVEVAVRSARAASHLGEPLLEEQLADLVWSALSLADHPELALEAATLLPAWADDDE